MGKWEPGQSGNPAGRPPGSRNKRDADVWAMCDARGDRDVRELFSETANNPDLPLETRLAAGKLCAEWRYSKPQATPTKIFVERPVTLPHPAPRSIQQAAENILYLSNLKATGELDLVAGDNLIADQRFVLNALVDEAKLIAAGADQGDQVIRIEGGLPTLTGTDIIMPAINGHVVEELPPPSQIESAAVPSDPPPEAADPESQRP